MLLTFDTIFPAWIAGIPIVGLLSLVWFIGEFSAVSFCLKNLIEQNHACLTVVREWKERKSQLGNI